MRKDKPTKYLNTPVFMGVWKQIKTEGVSGNWARRPLRRPGKKTVGTSALIVQEKLAYAPSALIRFHAPMKTGVFKYFVGLSFLMYFFQSPVGVTAVVLAPPMSTILS